MKDRGFKPGVFVRSKTSGFKFRIRQLSHDSGYIWAYRKDENNETEAYWFHWSELTLDV
jgi:hypothetical protein